jgi:hypothetical protein
MISKDDFALRAKKDEMCCAVSKSQQSALQTKRRIKHDDDRRLK